jgi:hypothetical protein
MLSLANERLYMCITVLAEPNLSTVYDSIDRIRCTNITIIICPNISLYSNPAFLIYNKV